MEDLIVRCSSLHKMMVNPQGKTPHEKCLEAVLFVKSEKKKFEKLKNKETKSAITKKKKIEKTLKLIPELYISRNDGLISETTKTWLKDMVKEKVFGYYKQLDTPAINKGIDFEDFSIELQNEVNFKNYQKNKERKTNSWLTGEADIVTENEIKDTKTSWSLETFPVFQEDAEAQAKKAGYDWQLKGYMLLWEKPKSSIDYCMISTPDYLLKEWDNKKIHKVDHIDPKKRITSVEFERCEELEKKMYQRYLVTNKFYKKYLTELLNK